MGAGSLSELDRERTQLARIGFIAALEREARRLAALVRDSSSTVASCGMGVEAATSAARAVADAGASVLVSWGFAGGLDETFQSGTLFSPSRVLFEGREFYPDPAWRKLICAGLVGVENGTLLTSPVPLTDLQEKRMAFERCGARAVDMECAAIARVAYERGMPFIAIKVILDTATDVLPAFVVKAVALREHISSSKFLLALLRQPTCLPACWRLIANYQCALGALDAAASQLHPLLLDVSRSTAD